MTASSRLALARGRVREGVSDGDLARSLIQGDTSAEPEAWFRFLPAVRGNLRRLLGPGLDEEDLAQEVFLRFFRRVTSLREPDAVRGFLFTICAHVARKDLRRKWLRRWLSLTPTGQLPDLLRADSGDTHRESDRAVKRYYEILDRVGGEGRSLFVTRYIEGLPLAEVARIHDQSISTTQRRLARVEKRIEAMVRRDPVLVDFVSADAGNAP